VDETTTRCLRIKLEIAVFLIAALAIIITIEDKE